MAARLATAAGVGATIVTGLYVYQQYKAQVPPLPNQAFIFVKPEAVTDPVIKLVRDRLRSKEMTIVQEGELTAEEMDSKKLIDNHYYALASKATLLKPTEMNVPEDKFKAAFGVSFQDAVKQNKVMNALDACKDLNIPALKMASLWADAKKNQKMTKLGGGFYCAEIEHNKKKLYVFNGFYMSMRDAYTAKGKKIHYYVVEWDPARLSWKDFRGKVLGATDPKEAPADSLRGTVLRDWKSLGLTKEPNVGDNAVHGSASPFEGMVERMNWLGTKCANDTFCSELLNLGMGEKTILAWTKDPQVRGKSLFDTLEDMNARNCAVKASSLVSP